MTSSVSSSAWPNAMHLTYSDKKEALLHLGANEASAHRVASSTRVLVMSLETESFGRHVFCRDNSLRCSITSFFDILDRSESGPRPPIMIVATMRGDPTGATTVDFFVLDGPEAEVAGRALKVRSILSKL